MRPLLDSLARSIASHTGLAADTVAGMIEVPPDPALGDAAFPCFTLAKTMRKAPGAIATELAAQLTSNDCTASAVGPYVNVRFSVHALLTHLPEVGVAARASGETICIESPSPNTNKPLHLGHARNMLLGNAIVSLLKRQGHTVKRLDLVNDRGVHICKSMLAYERWGEGATPTSLGLKGDHFSGHFYVRFAQALEKYAALEEEAQAMLKRWEEGDPEVRALWKKMRDWCLEGFAQTYADYGVVVDHADYESEIYAIGKQIVADGLAAGVFERDETGAIFATLPSGKKFLQRADGTSIYITQDLALAARRFEKFGMDRLVYVVGNEQNYHFETLFAIFKLLGFPFAEKCYHLSYGMIYLPEGKMKSREGTVVDADDLRSELISMAADEVRQRSPQLGEHELLDRARAIAMGALRFYILKYDPRSDFTYNPAESIAFTGDTGPYVQYTYARICSIFRKAGTHPAADAALLTHEIERRLLVLLTRYASVLAGAAGNYRPNELCAYLLELAQVVNSYYHDVQINVDDRAVRAARLWLLDRIREVLADGLGLLGIDVIDEM